MLDETDSGLDIDALNVVANGVNSLRSADRAMLLITHYQRLLDYIVPDYVHVLSRGRICAAATSRSRSSSRSAATTGCDRRRRSRERHAPPGSARQAAYAARGAPGLQPADRARRETAFARFFELGFPAANDEDWKYTSLRRLESRSFASAVRARRLRQVPADARVDRRTARPDR